MNRVLCTLQALYLDLPWGNQTDGQMDQLMDIGTVTHAYTPYRITSHDKNTHLLCRFVAVRDYEFKNKI